MNGALPDDGRRGHGGAPATAAQAAPGSDCCAAGASLPPPRGMSPLPRVAPEVPALLLVTGEDLHPESLVGPSVNVLGAVVAPGGGSLSELRPDGAVRAASPDVGARVGEHYRCAAAFIDILDGEALIAAAEAAGARAIVTPYAPVGPVADALHRLAPTPAAAGLPLYQERRRLDELAWPLATRGFFPFRAAIPDIVRQLAAGA